jgi:hypothetical protein
LASCKREADDLQPAAAPQVIPSNRNPAADFVQTAVSDPAAAEFISGEFDGRLLTCAYDRWGDSGCAYRSATDQGILVRQNRGGDLQLNITYNFTNLFTSEMPAVWPQPVATPLYCQGFYLDLFSLTPDNGVKMLFHGATGAQVLATSTNSFKFTVTSIRDNFVEGIFEGPLYIGDPLTLSDCQTKYGAKADLPVIVKNGKFRVKAVML